MYPVFSWKLFHRLPQPVEKELTVRFIEISGVPLSEPVLLDYAEEYFEEHPVVTSYFPIFQNMRGGILEGDGVRIARARREFESQLTVDHAVYELVELHIDTVEYWKSRAVQDVEVIATFVVGPLAY